MIDTSNAIAVCKFRRAQCSVIITPMLDDVIYEDETRSFRLRVITLLDCWSLGLALQRAVNRLEVMLELVIGHHDATV